MHCLAFNPLTSQIFSAGSADYAIWTPDTSVIDKQKTKDKVISCGWSADGQQLAYGSISGQLCISNRKGDEKQEFKTFGPVWCMEWTPISPDNQESILFVGVWPNTIQIYNSQGQQLGSNRKLGFDPLYLNFNSTGEMYLVSGTNNKVTLYTREGGQLIEAASAKDWILCAKMKGNGLTIACTTNDGEIFVN